MVAKAAIWVSKRRQSRALMVTCLLTSQILALVLLSNCGDGDAVMAMRQTLSLVGV